MGNSNSGSLDFEYSITAADYSPVRKFDDFLFGEFYEVRHNSTRDILLLKIKTITDPQKYQQVIEQSFQRLSLSHKNLSKIHGFAGRESTTPISITYKIYIYFQPLPKDLARVIKARKSTIPAIQPGSSKFLPEPQLNSLLEQFIDVLEFLQVKGISHGDIRPEACFLTDEWNLMLCDRRLIYDSDSDFSQGGNEKNVLFSPAGFDAYIKKDKNFKENQHKRDVFSVGMTLLECATYKRSAHIYEWTNPPKINKDVLFTRLHEIQSRYSHRTVQILAEMLQFDEGARPDFIRLKKWITGSEPIGLINVCPSPSRKSESHATPQKNKFDLGSPQMRTSIKLTPGYEKLAVQTVTRDQPVVEHKGIILESPKRRFGGKDAEDEVVEFETEESPKKLIAAMMHNRTPSATHTKNYSSLSKEIINQSIKQSPYNFMSATAGYQEQPSFSNTGIANTSYLAKTFHENMEAPKSKAVSSGYGLTDVSPEHKPSYNDYGYTKDFNSPVSVDSIMKKAQVANAFSPTNTASYGSQSPYKEPLSASKPYLYGLDNNLSVSTDAYTANSGSQSASKLVSPYLQITSPSGTRSTSVYFGEPRNTTYPVQEPQKKFSEGAYSPHSPVQQQTSFMDSLKSPGIAKTNSQYSNNFLLPPLTKENSGSTNKLENSFSLNLSADTEQWRSMVADGYSTVLSVGPSSPKSGAQPTTDLLSQQLKSYSSNKYSNSGNPFVSHALNQDSGSRTSIEQDEEGFEKKYTKSAFAKQGSMQTIGNGHLQPKDVSSSYTTPNTVRDVEHKSYSTHAKFSDNEADNIFKKAMERSKETYNMVKSRDNLDYSVNGSIMNNESLLDRMRREGLATGKNY